jgi:RNase adaptor protein for sRNA GlmZ degradation
LGFEQTQNQVICPLTFKRRNAICLYKESVRTALSTLAAPVLKTNQLLTHTAKPAVCTEIRTKRSTQSEHDVEFFNFKYGGK